MRKARILHISCSLWLGGVFAGFAAEVRAEIHQNTHTDAQNSIFSLSLEELSQVTVSIATGTENTLKSAPAITSVITANDILKLGARTLDEVLETVPGLHVSLSGVNRLDSIYSMRGIHTGFNPHVLLLLDGNPVQWTLQGGRPILYRLPANMVDRIEVIRGPGSAMYGSDAFSGVINVITKTADTIEHNEIAVRGGSFNTRDVWANLGYQLGNWQTSANFTYMSSEGDQDRIVDQDLQTVLDAQLGTDASHAPGPLATDYEIVDLHLKASNPLWDLNFWHWSTRNTGNGAGGAQALDPKTKEYFRSFFFDVKWHPETEFWGWRHTLKTTYFNHKSEGNLTLLPENAVAPIGADGNINFNNPVGVTLFTDGVIGQPAGVTEEVFAEWVATKHFFEAHQLRIASGYKEQTLESEEKKNFGPGVLDGTQQVVDGSLTDVSNTPYKFVPDTNRKIFHLALQDEWQLAQNWALTGGVRYDRYSDFGGTTNPRFALVWNTSAVLTTKFLYGSAFRAPSFGELLFQNNPATIGNPDLEPETIDTAEVAFSYSPFSRVRADLNIYHYQAENMIEFVPGDAGSTAQNIGNQNGEGFEFEVKWSARDNLDFTVNGAWQKSYNTETKERIADAPARQAMFMANWEFQHNWLANLRGKWIADRQRMLGDQRPQINDYSLVELQLIRRDLLPGFDISFKALNLFDADAREPSSGVIANDYPLEGRGFWLQLLYRLQN
ncbi:iron complex outermembrane receptor protein [Alteromonadaceae bacterium 2753L.S.0a.02]|nr:iron complex outermembrane receptor protein [Alteromonadaceae bacterium 2753L.S.0a.02]